METELVSQQDQIELVTDENAPTLRTWSTPILQRLNGDASASIKNIFTTENSSDLLAPS